jgi:hypothetical protein
MNRFYTLILLIISFSALAQQKKTEYFKLSDEIITPNESIINNVISNTNTPTPLKMLGSGNDICSEAISLTVGNNFTCSNTSTNVFATSFPSTCVTTSGGGLKDIAVDWYCFNSGTNKTLAIVTHSATNTTAFVPAMAVFGPYATCTGGCAASMSGPLCDDAISLPYTDSIKILENLSQNSYYMIAVVARMNNTGGSIGYCISVQPTNLDDCEVPSSACPTTCGNLCVFDTASAPSVPRVVGACTPITYSHRIQGAGVTSPADTVEFCYNFRVDAGCTMSFAGVITASGCTGGNLTSANWRIVNASTCGVVQSGTSVPVTAVVSTAGNYIYCFKYSAACDLQFAVNNFGYGTCIVQLPVELLFFTGKKLNENNIALDWATASELNNNYFEIERSNDAINFSSIGNVASKATNGNSNYKIDYQFIDNAPLQGINYYRLKQVDIDNTTKHSKIISVVMKNAKDDLSIVGITPSINNETPKLIFNTSLDEILQVSIYNTLGQLIKSDNTAALAGNNSYEINTYNLHTGIYYLTLSNNQNKQISTKLFVK